MTVVKLHVRSQPEEDDRVVFKRREELLCPRPEVLLGGLDALLWTNGEKPVGSKGAEVTLPQETREVYEKILVDFVKNQFNPARGLDVDADFPAFASFVALQNSSSLKLLGWNRGNLFDVIKRRSEFWVALDLVRFGLAQQPDDLVRNGLSYAGNLGRLVAVKVCLLVNIP